MPEICNDSRTLCFVEDPRGAFDVQTGGRSGTPTIEVPVINGNLIEVTAQFTASTPSGGGFDFTIQATSGDAKKLSERGASTVQTQGGWVTCVRTDYFIAVLPEATADEDVSLEVVFDAGSFSDHGQAGSFLLIAKIVGSKVIP